ncbi:AER087Cp [Eremothecium gossypii ATCC 10895]|uniref:Ornithine decarboxylase n=1 Tax=Eremothecium gossypii (strain ATCC 10895 / CBS 109.51 / FGSC 9923 / NRRL Y-1056) TaxID=284811 RepID=Q757C6_EREGS|nr:AER087Cp [Eremothecium gossypii ATCC 10895]AAS52771.2 AER087Cp [Eremothecium gossypii ATCC 10895]AEY97077.1 FAER087Cp [Eremothecium gossypii FDAG1]
MIAKEIAPALAQDQPEEVKHDSLCQARDHVTTGLAGLVATDPTTQKTGAHEQAHQAVFQAMKEHVERVNKDTCDAGEENSFFVCDLGEVERLLRYWRRELPRVQPYYAVKCNPDVRVLERLASLGVNFDCASKAEIERVLQLGVAPERIIYANPCKVSSFIRFAAARGVRQSTFDNVEELYKIARFHPESQLLLRISTDDSTAQCQLSAKYGCSPDEVDPLLAKVAELGLNLVGVSFHIGSGASDFSSLTQAVVDARRVFDRAAHFGLPALRVLDVGGGFQFDTFHQSSAILNAALDTHFPPGSGVELIAEPGRFLVATAFTLSSHVIAKRELPERGSMLYINDGIYANMNCILFDHYQPTPRVLYHAAAFHYFDTTSSKSRTAACPHRTSIWGPTCDGLDCITDEYYLRYDLAVGDWLYFANFGAYTSSAATPFNGFEAAVEVIYIDTA